MEKRECPHNWSECDACINYQLCKLGVYVPPEENEEEQREAVKQAAEKAGEIVYQEAVKSAKKVAVVRANTEEFWRWFNAGKRASDLRVKEIMPPGGAIERGGGSKSGKRHKNPPKKAPEYLRTWGT